MIVTAPRRPAARLSSTLLASTALVVLSLSFAGSASANPTAPVVVGGAPVISGVGTASVEVDLTAQRTIVDWGSFNIDPGDTTKFVFGGKNWIALNRVNAGSATINGNLLGCLDAGCASYGGNIWLFASDGVLVGGNAVVNTGGLLMTTSPMSTSDSNFLAASEPVANQFDFGASTPATSVSLQSGAQINAFGGTIALVAPSVSTASGSSVATTAGQGTVLYGAASSFRIKFAQSVGNDLDLVNFEVPTGAAGGTGSTTPISIGGSTSAGNVYMAAVRPAAVADALISISGTVTATQAASVGGNIVLSAGGINGGAAEAPDPTSSKVNISVDGQMQADTQTVLKGTGTVASTAPIVGKLTGSTNGGADLIASQVGDFTNSGSGDISIHSAQGIAVSGTLTNTVGNIDLTASLGDILLTGTVDGTGHTVTMVDSDGAGGDIDASGGVVKAAHLTGSATGSADFSNTANLIDTLDAFHAANGFTLKNGQGLTVAGTDVSSLGITGVDAGSGDLGLTVTGDLTFGATLTAGTATGSQQITLDASGAVTQTGGHATAGTIDTTSGTGKDTTLTAVSAANATFLAGGSYGLTDDTAVTIGGTATLGSVTVDPPSITVTAISAGTSVTLISDTFIDSASAASTITAGTTLDLQAGTSISFDGVLDATTLTGSSVGATTLGTTAVPVANLIGTLGAFQAGGGFSLTDAEALNFSGADVDSLGFTGLDAGTGNLTLGVTGNLDLTSDLTAGTATGSQSITLGATGHIAQTAGHITAGFLDTTSGAGFDTTLNNVSAAGVTFDSGNNYSLTDDTDVTIGGTAAGSVGVDPPSITVTNISAGGSVTLVSTTFIDSASSSSTITAGTTLDMQAGTSIVFDGVLDAASLTGKSGGATTLGDFLNPVANQIGTLGAFKADGGFSLTNGEALDVTGADVDALGFTGVGVTTGDMFLQTTTGGLTFSTATSDLKASGRTVTLISADVITQNLGSGVITSGTLTGSSAGATMLGDYGDPVANKITTLAAFKANGGFSLTDNQTLSVTGTDVDALGFSGVGITTGDMFLQTTAGSLLFTAPTAALKAAGRTVTLVSAAAITQSAGSGGITSANLTGYATTTVSLGTHANPVANKIGTLQAFRAPGGMSLTNNQALVVGGTDVDAFGFTGVNVTTGDLWLETTAGGMNLTAPTATANLNAAGRTVTLVSAAGITQDNLKSVVTADTLTGSSVGATSLGTHTAVAVNQIATLAAFNALGGFSLTDHQALTVSGTDVKTLGFTGVSVSSGDMLIETTLGNLNLTAPTATANLNAAGRTVTLVSASAITQDSAKSVITADTLTGSSAGATSLGTHASPAQNVVNTLAAFRAIGGISFTDNHALTVSGADVKTLGFTGVNVTSGDVWLETLTGGMTFTAPTATANVNAAGRTVTLVSAADITQDNLKSVITAATLTGSSVGATGLGTHSAPSANLIGTLAAFRAPAGFSLTNNQALIVSGVDVSSLGFTGVNVTTGDMLIETDTGGMSLTAPTATANLNAAGRTVTLVSAAGITQDSAKSVITADTLTGQSAGATSLGTHASPALNLINTLAAFRATGGITLTDNPALTVSGTDVKALGFTGVNVTSGDVWLETLIGGINFTAPAATANINAAGRTVTLVSAADITQDSAKSAITADTLTGSSAGATSLGIHVNPAANHIANLASFRAPAGFSLTNNQALNVTGVDVSALGFTGVNVTTGDMLIETTAGALTFTTATANLNAAGRTVTLISAANIAQNGGVITAATLTGSSVNATVLGTHASAVANKIATLASFRATGGMSLTDNQALDVTGADVKALGFTGVNVTSGDLWLETTAGGLSFSTATSNLNAAGRAVTLVSTAAITQNAGSGVISAATLTGSSAGATALNAANLIGTLNAFRAGSGFSLTNAQALTVAGADSSTLGFTGVNAGTGNLALTVTGDVTTTANLTAGTVASAQSATIITSAAFIQNAGTITSGTIDLRAGSDIRIGAVGFTDSVRNTSGAALATFVQQQQQINLGTNTVFMSAASIKLKAPGKIVQQNTGSQTDPRGLVVTQVTPLPDAVSLDGAPTIVSLYGKLMQNGNPIPDNLFATSGQVVFAGPTVASQNYRINGCIIHQTGACAIIQFNINNIEPARLTDALTLRGSDDDEDQDDPKITGSGNPEIWQDE